MTAKKLCIGILSCADSPQHARRRESCFRTWVREIPRDAEIDVRFVIEGSVEIPAQRDEFLEVPPGQDGSGRFRSQKCLSFLQYALDAGYRWICVCYDTTYIEIESLLAFRELEFEGADYFGVLDSNRADEIDSAQGGLGYVVSNSAAARIVEEIGKREVIPPIADDLLIAQLCNELRIPRHLLDLRDPLKPCYSWAEVYDQSFDIIQSALYLNERKELRNLPSPLFLPPGILYDPYLARDFSGLENWNWDSKPGHLPSVTEAPLHTAHDAPKTCIAVFSAEHGAEYERRRENCARTWLAECFRYEGLDPIFVLETSELRTTRAGNTLLLHSSGHQGWRSLPLKTAALLKHVRDEGYDFLLKCDDDSYIDLQALEFWREGRFRGADYIGVQVKDGKGGISYPQGGLGYVLSRRAVEAFVSYYEQNQIEHAIVAELSRKESDWTQPYLCYEDSLVAWVLAQCGITPYYLEIESPIDRTFSWHYVFEDGFDLLHDSLHKAGADVYGDEFRRNIQSYRRSGSIMIPSGTLYSELMVRDFSQIEHWLLVQQLERNVARDGESWRVAFDTAANL